MSSNRTVSVRLQAEIGQYVSGMSKASAATMRLGDSATTSSTKARAGFDMAGKGALLLGGAVVAGLGMAVSKSMEFETSMSAVKAATGAAGIALEDLRETAMKAGADTQYSATEAADAITEMAKAGVSAEDIMSGGLTGALSLAAAGQLDVAEAAGIASVAMTQFGLAGEDLPHVADLLAAGAGKAMGSVDDLGQALNQAGLVASATGVSIEETTGTLAAFASAGLIGSDAGTSLKTALQKLQAPSKEASGLMDELGINMYDANGEFIGMSALAGQLKDGMSGLTQAERDKAMATIFGSDAVRAANVLYKEGAAGIAEWTAKVNDQGYAAEQAAALNDNLKGDLERLGGAFDTLMIQMGSGAQGPLREIVQMFTGLLDVAADVLGFWGSLPGPVQIAVGALGAIALLKGPVGGALESIQLRAMYAAEAMMNPRSGLASAGSRLLGVFGGPWGLAITGAVTGLSLLTTWLGKSSVSTQQAEAYQDRLTAALEETNGALDENIRAIAAREAAETEIGNGNLLTVSRELGVELPRVTDALLGNREAYDEIDAAAEAYLRRAQELSGFNTEDPGFVAAVEKVSGYRSALEELFPNLAGIEQGQEDVAAATAETGAVAQETTVMTEEATKALEDWLKALQGISAGFVEPLSTYKGLLDEKTTAEREAAEKTAASTESTKDSWEDYVDDVSVSLDELATRLEEQLLAQDKWRENIGIITRRGGMEVGQILAGMGEEGVQLAAEMANGTDAEFNRMADLLIEDARRGGAGAAAALDQEMKVMAEIGAQGASATALAVAQKLGLGLGEVRRIAGEYGVQLATGLEPLLAALGARQIAIQTRGNNPNAPASGRFGFAEGGYTGPGGKYQPAGIVHAGEYVLTQEQVNSLGIDAIEAFANRGYASGGFVTAADVPRPRSTAPYAPPISSAGDGTMQLAYNETVAWMKANVGVLGMGAVGGAWGSLWSLVKAAIPQARMNSTFRPGDPGYHGRGKAIDFGFGSGPGGAGSAGLASINRFLHDRVGGNLAELIYDGIGDDRPDIKNGRPHTYNAGTRAEHRNHVHAAVYDQGGVMGHGTAGINLSGFPERVLNPRETAAYDAGLRAREFSGGSSSGGAGGPVSVNVQARVFVGDREITDIARVEAVAVLASASARQDRDSRSWQ